MSNFKEMKVWDAKAPSLWQEIVERWGCDSYSNPTIRENKLAILSAEYNTSQYQRDRASEYPSITDYLDGIVKGDTVQVNKYIADCQAVKDKYPKETI